MKASRWLLAVFAGIAMTAVAAIGDPVKVVYHMNEGVDHAPQMLRNIRNRLNADPKAFRACEYTLKSRNIDPKNVIEEARLVPSGVAEVARLQAQEGFVYLKP